MATTTLLLPVVMFQADWRVDFGEAIKAPEAWIVGSRGQIRFGGESKDIVRLGVQNVWILLVQVDGFLDGHIPRQLRYFQSTD